MVRITIDEELKQKLQGAQGSVMLCDSTGRMIASVTTLPEGVESLWELLPELTDDEIQRRCKDEGPWLSTEEAKRFLQDRS
ncbi:MAG: hypothetical protein KDA37_15715 [Planctomycetales bacterium]|nr:hypothetical protein [Planctomycetales bacterium]